MNTPIKNSDNPPRLPRRLLNDGWWLEMPATVAGSSQLETYSKNIATAAKLRNPEKRACHLKVI